MGSFFTNVQVYTGGRDRHEVRSNVIKAVRQWVQQGPFISTERFPKTEPSKGSSEGSLRDEGARTVLIAPAGLEPWIAVYDEATEDQGETLSEVARALTAAIGSSALTILVHDDDILMLGLFSSGHHVDTYDSWPDYFGPIPQSKRDEVAGHPELWRDVLMDKTSQEKLRDVMAKAKSAPYILLDQIGSLLGLNPARAGTGSNYLLQDEADLTGFAELVFRSREDEQ